MGNQSKLLNPARGDSHHQVVNLCIICHQRLKGTCSSEFPQGIPLEAQDFILKDIFLVRDSIFQKLTENITKYRIKQNVLFQLCSECEFNMKLVNDMLNGPNYSEPTMTSIVERLQKKKRDALTGVADRFAPVSSTSFDVPLSESSHITPEEMDVLRRVEHLKKGQVELEQQQANLIKIQSAAMPLSVKRAKLDALNKQTAEDAVEPPTTSFMTPTPPTPKSTSRSLKRKNKREPVYRYTGSEIYGDLRKSDRISKKASSQDELNDQVSVAISSSPASKQKFLEDLETYGRRMLNWSKVAMVENASASLEAQLKTCPGKYIKKGNREPGQLCRRKSAHRCRLCLLYFSHECTLLYHYDRVHFGTKLPCKCPSCGKSIVSIKRGVEHVKLCVENNPTDKINGWIERDDVVPEAAAAEVSTPLPGPVRCHICTESFPSQEEKDAHIEQEDNREGVEVNKIPDEIEPPVVYRNIEIAAEEETERDSGNNDSMMEQAVAPMDMGMISVYRQGEDLFEDTEIYVKRVKLEEMELEEDDKMMEEEEADVYPCTLCTRTFKNNKVLQFHRITRHNCVDVYRQFPVCDDCDEVCLSEEFLQMHIVMFHPIRKT